MLYAGGDTREASRLAADAQTNRGAARFSPPPITVVNDHARFDGLGGVSREHTLPYGLRGDTTDPARQAVAIGKANEATSRLRALSDEVQSFGAPSWFSGADYYRQFSSVQNKISGILKEYTTYDEDLPTDISGRLHGLLIDALNLSKEVYEGQNASVIDSLAAILRDAPSFVGEVASGVVTDLGKIKAAAFDSSTMLAVGAILALVLMGRR